MILGHERQIKYLETVIKKNRMAHAHLFFGPEHVGKLVIAKMVAKALFCPHAKGGLMNVCHKCEACQKIEKNMHPEVIFLDTEHTLVSKKETRKDIPIDDIRELKRVLSFAPHGAAWRVVIINEAEKMSAEAANAFLKILEEPGDLTLIILITSSRELLLPTILSRTQQIGFSLVSDEILKKFLEREKKYGESHEEMLKIAGGRAGVLMRMREEKTFLSEERTFFGAIQKGLDRKSVV